MPGEAVQGAIAEAVTGVIDLDNLLVVVQYFGLLAPEVVSIRTGHCKAHPPERA